jgi:hypothetical protein
MDMLAAVVLALCTSAMGYFGVHVTLHPPANPSSIRRYKQGFIGLAVLATLLIAFQEYRTSRTLGAIEYNTERPALISVTKLVPVRELDPGALCDWNVYYRDAGNGPTIGVGSVGAVVYLSEPIKDAETEKQSVMEKRFYEWWRAPGSHVYKLTVLHPNDEYFVTSEAPILTAPDVEKIRSGAMVIYVLGSTIYADIYGSHTQDFCRVSQPPQKTMAAPSGLASQIIFHDCTFHTSLK